MDNEQEKEKSGSPLKLIEKLGYGAGSVAESTMQNSFNGMLMPIMNVTLGVSPILLGYVIAISRIWDAITDLLIGYVSDCTRSRWGRRKPYILSGCILTAFAFVLIWSFPLGKSDNWYFWYLVVTSLIYYSMSSIYCVPYISYGYELCKDYHERTKLMGYRSLFVFGGALVLPWMYWFTKLPCFANAAEGMWYLSFIIGAYVIFFGLCPVLLTRTVANPEFVKLPPEGEAAAELEATPESGMDLEIAAEAVKTEAEATPELRKLSVSDIFSSFKVMPFTLLIIALGVCIISIYTVSAFGFYLKIYYVCGGDKVMGAKLQGLQGTISCICNVLSIPLINYLSRRLGKSLTLILAFILGGIGALLVLVIYNPNYPYLCLVQPILASPAGTGMWMLIFAMIPDVCDWDELHNNCRREGIFAAGLSWTVKFGISMCGILSGYFLVWSGFQQELGGAQGADTFTTMRVLYAIVPSAGLFIGAALLTLYPLTEKKVTEIKEELKKRNNPVK